jgi:Spy/CpxP family protein refolding chaperone
MQRFALGCLIYLVICNAALATPSSACNCANNLSTTAQMLTLSPEQNEKIRNLIAILHPLIDTNQNMLTVLGDQINAVSHSARTDEKSLNLLIEQRAAMVAKDTKLRSHLTHQIQSVLTPAQKQLLQNMYPDWQSKVDALSNFNLF